MPIVQRLLPLQKAQILAKIEVLGNTITPQFNVCNFQTLNAVNEQAVRQVIQNTSECGEPTSERGILLNTKEEENNMFELLNLTHNTEHITCHRKRKFWRNSACISFSTIAT